MILLDSRVGSKHLADDFSDIGASYEKTRLEFGDASFQGNGDNGPVAIGVEIKNVADLANSMASGRLAGHQVPGLLERYQHVWLVVEGFYRRHRTSDIVEMPSGAVWKPLYLGKRPVFWGQLEAFLTSLEVMAGIKVRRTRTTRETAEFIVMLHGWWQKPWEQHKSLNVVHRAAPRADLRQLDDVTKNIRDVALTMPGIGYDRALAVAKSFECPADLAIGTVRDYEQIPGVGRTLAKRIVDFWHKGRETH